MVAMSHTFAARCFSRRSSGKAYRQRTAATDWRVRDETQNRFYRTTSCTRLLLYAIQRQGSRTHNLASHNRTAQKWNCRGGMKKETLEAFEEIRKALGGDTPMISRCRTEQEEAEILGACPECGEPAEWVDCEECQGAGTIQCICEGECGEYRCTMGCDV
jgi:hypothetical protein